MIEATAGVYGNAFGALRPEEMLGPDGKRLSNEDLQLKNSCREFEAVLVATMLKEALRGAAEAGKIDDEENDGDNGSEMFKEMANEQLAYHVGRQGIMGIGDLIFRNIQESREMTTKDPFNPDNEVVSKAKECQGACGRKPNHALARARHYLSTPSNVGGKQ